MLTFGRSGANPWAMKRILALCGSGVGLALAGCVQIQAPSKPIEINLNVNIRQEVVLSLKKDAQDLVTNNPELFPQ
ncbi:MAG: hypothetical protein RL764_1277 [Pseudomonadota bacterium]|jgi:hypothetical protein